jgi:DNA primase
MDAIALLNKHMDMYKLLEYYDFDRVKQEGSMIRSCCKLHGGSNPSGFVVNTSNNLWYCHTGGCGGGDAFTLVKRLEECSFAESVHIVARIIGVDIENMEILEQKASYMEDVRKWVKTMRSRMTVEKPVIAYQISTEQKDVAKFRDFDRETLEHFGLKYVERVHLMSRDNKPYSLTNRLVFPVVYNGVIVGASLRRIKATDEPKWSHQPVSLETSEILYNFDACEGLSTIVICEGIVDVWAYYEIGITACATFGAHLTETQYRLLMRTGADLVWSYDGDHAGRVATEKATSTFHNKANQYTVYFDDGEDPASLSREELRKRYGERNRT